jgi:uncharacterized protein (UPF0297 family)
MINVIIGSQLSGKSSYLKSIPQDNEFKKSIYIEEMSKYFLTQNNI